MTDHPMTTRRTFLGNSLTLVGAGATVPAFLDQTAWALARPDDAPLTKSKPGVPDDRVLVVVQLAGGNDGLNTVVPVRNDDYRKGRPRLAIAAGDTLRIDDELGFHPAAKGLKSLYDDGLLGIVQGLGYPNPNRSHFKSTDIWESASPDGRQHSGWLGRYFDNACTGADPCPSESAIALKGEAPMALHGEQFRAVAFTNPQALQWNLARRRGRGAAALKKSFENLNQPEEREADEAISELAYLQRTALDARLSADQIRKAVGARSRAQYPGQRFSQSLRTVARMIAAGLPTKVYYVSLGGFDTHANQVGRHTQLMTQLGDGLRAFVSDLKGQGNLDRTLIMTFSEFGRRVTENASGGTDHGEASCLFLAGTAIEPGLHGTYPSLAPKNRNRGDLAFTTDFRRVYAAILGDWLKADATKILGQKFEPLELVRT